MSADDEVYLLMELATIHRGCCEECRRRDPCETWAEFVERALAISFRSLLVTTAPNRPGKKVAFRGAEATVCGSGGDDSPTS